VQTPVLIKLLQSTAHAIALLVLCAGTFSTARPDSSASSLHRPDSHYSTRGGSNSSTTTAVRPGSNFGTTRHPPRPNSIVLPAKAKGLLQSPLEEAGGEQDLSGKLPEAPAQHSRGSKDSVKGGKKATESSGATSALPAALTGMATSQASSPAGRGGSKPARTRAQQLALIESELKSISDVLLGQGVQAQGVPMGAAAQNAPHNSGSTSSSGDAGAKKSERRHQSDTSEAGDKGDSKGTSGISKAAEEQEISGTQPADGAVVGTAAPTPSHFSTSAQQLSDRSNAGGTGHAAHQQEHSVSSQATHSHCSPASATGNAPSSDELTGAVSVANIGTETSTTLPMMGQLPGLELTGTLGWVSILHSGCSVDSCLHAITCWVHNETQHTITSSAEFST
jgi:hypothetical protein